MGKPLILETGMTNKKGSFIISNNGTYTEQEQARIDEGGWVKYEKDSNGLISYPDTEEADPKEDQA